MLVLRLNGSSPGEGKSDLLRQSADELRMDAEVLRRELESHQRTHSDYSLN